jgi:S1-C subfamily serine protease
MRSIVRAAGLMLLLFALAGGALSQDKLPSKTEEQVPIATEWLLAAATTPGERSAIKSVFILHCPKSASKGTSFLLKTGIVVTNAHVVRGCEAKDLWALSPLNKTIRFSKLVADESPDLAILLPTERLEGGFELGSSIDPPLRSPVYTWGFPLGSKGPAPLLSVGYVAGYASAENNGRKVKHFVVNGAFNPGNSGGPVFIENGDNKIVGIVVNKWTLFSEQTDFVISVLEAGRSGGFGGAFVRRMPDGTNKPIYNDQAIAAVLRDFYQDVQVMIGEAIAVSELRSFLKENEKELRQVDKH